MVVPINRILCVCFRRCARSNGKKLGSLHPSPRPSPRPTTATLEVKFERLYNQVRSHFAAEKQRRHVSSSTTPLRPIVTRHKVPCRDMLRVYKNSHLRLPYWKSCCMSYTGHLSQTAGLALPLEQAEDVALADGALDVADDGTCRVVNELHAYLSAPAQKQRSKPSVSASVEQKEHNKLIFKTWQSTNEVTPNRT